MVTAAARPVARSRSASIATGRLTDDRGADAPGPRCARGVHLSSARAVDRPL